MKSIKIIILLILLSLSAKGQEETVDLLLDEFLFGTSSQDSLIEAILINDTDISDLISALNSYKYIYARSEFENKTYFSGQDLGIDQYNISSHVFYQSPKGLNIGAAGIVYSGFKPKFNTAILSAGYNNRIRAVKGMSVRASYNRFFFAKVDSVEEYAFNNSVNVGATYQLKNIGTSADFSLLIGSETSSQFSWDIFSEFTLLRLGLFNKLKFTPEISLYAGNETVVTSQFISFRRFTGEIYSEKSTFGLMNTVIRIPLTLAYKNLDLTTGYNINFPRIPGATTNPVNTSFFNISVGYMFGL